MACHGTDQHIFLLLGPELEQFLNDLLTKRQRKIQQRFDEMVART